MTRFASIAMITACISLAACASGPPRRVSEPAANIQQLTVRADGSWSVDLRIENFSSVPMRFDDVSLAMSVGADAAGTLQATPALAIGPESADVVTLAMSPSTSAKVAVADALARAGNVNYILDGTLRAAADKAGVRSYRIKRSNTLSAVPGLPGVLR